MSCCLVYSGMIIVRSCLLSIVAKSQLQSDSATEMFISFQNYCVEIVGDNVYQGEWTIVFAVLLSV
jgi:hypothetical protein